MSELKLLMDHQEGLVKMLSALSTDALLKVAKDLQRYCVITSDNMDTLSSLDHDRLDSGTTVRYLLQLVYERIVVDSTLYNKFMKVLLNNKEKGVAQVFKAIADQLVTLTTDEGASSPTERILLEADVTELWEVLIECSHKWEEISVLLKLPTATIEECRNASSNNLRLHKALTEWVCGNHEQAKPPTLSHLKHAIASPVLGQHNLSKKLDDLVQNIPCQPSKKRFKKNPVTLESQSVDTEVQNRMSTLLEVQVVPRESATYQWMKDEHPLSDSSSFSGTDSPILFLNKASQITQGQYYCHITIDKEQLTSSSAKVIVRYPTDTQALRDHYSVLKEVPDDSWPFATPNTFIDLAFVKTRATKSTDCCNFISDEMGSILQNKQRVDYHEAFSEYQSRAFVLVEGRPGSGKTTLAQKITKDWTKGEILQNVSKFFLVSLRRNYDKQELFSTFFPPKSDLYNDQLEETSGEGSCFVLDGYDEYGHKEIQESIINKLILKTYLPLAMVIVTSRPAATATLRPKATSIVEILGFTREQFDKFVSSYPFQDLAGSSDVGPDVAKVQSYVKASMDVLNVCYLPLNANILCFLYGHLQEEKFPTTETQIYDHFVRAIILRKLRTTNPSATLPSLRDLPETEAQDFTLVCSLAFQMTLECKQVVNKLSTPLKTSAVSSLLTIDKTVTPSGLEPVYSFLHLTLQEYLAAYHLANVDKHNQTIIIAQHGGKDHMLNTFKFYCGLVDYKTINEQFKHITKINDENKMLYSFHCAYQTQNKTICSLASQMQDGKVELSCLVLTPTDFRVLGYVISNSSHLIRSIVIPPCLLYEDYNNTRWLDHEADNTNALLYNFSSTHEIMNSRILEEACCARISYAIKSRDVLHKAEGAFEDRSSENLPRLFTLISQYATHTSDIFESDSAQPLIDALKQCHELHSLQIVSNITSRRSTNVIADILKKYTKIKQLRFTCNYNFLSGNVILETLQHYKHLQVLMVVNFKLNVDTTAALASVIAHCKDIKTLMLYDCGISAEGAEKIAHAISNLSVSALSLSQNQIQSKGLTYIADSLVGKSCIEEIKLRECRANLNGIRALSNVMNSFTNLQALDLFHNDVGPDGAADLVQGLESCSNIKALNLKNCNLTGRGIELLGKRLHTLKKLSCLNLSSNDKITIQEALVVADGLSFLGYLEELYLSNNCINCEAAKALSQGIQGCPHLHTLDLSNNCIGSNGIAATSASIRCTKMIFADFSHNTIQNDSVVSIVNLVQSSHLQKLDLSHNNIGSQGAKSLLTKLTTHPLPIKINLLSNNIQEEDIEILKGKCENYTLQVLLQ